MKTTTLTILIALALSSCEKETFVPKQKVEQQQVSDSLNYNLYWSSTQLGIQVENLKPSRIFKLAELNTSSGLNEVYGERVDFYSEDSTKLFQFVYIYGQGITEGFGRIDNKTFILNVQTSTINICQSSQNVEVEFDVFYKGQINS